MRLSVRMPSVRLTVLVICAVLASLLTALFLGTTARATGSWPVTVPYEQRPGQVMALPSGGAVVSDCTLSGGDPSQTREFSSYDSGATLANSVTAATSDELYFCGPGMAARGGGWVYGYRLTNSYTTYAVVGYRDGVEELTYPLVSGCTGSSYPASLIGMVLGEDGNLYVLQHSYPCNDSRVVVIDTSTYQTHTISLGTAADYYSNTSSVAYIAAYQDGIVVRYGYKKFRYFSYAGVEDTTKTYEPTLPSNQSIADWELNYDGDIFIVLDGSNYNRTGTCQRSYIVEDVIKRTPAGVVTSYDLEEQCMRLQDFGVTPSGGAVLTSKYDYTPDANPLVVLESDGDVSPAVIEIPYGYKNTTAQVYYSQVGINGNILFTRNLQNDTTYRIVTELELLGPDGQLLGRQISESLHMPSGSYAYMAPAPPATANGFVYAAFCERSFPYGCNVTHLHQIPFIEAAIEYPRGLVAGVSVPPDPTLDYVALGDSFSSGEGVPNFISGTDVDDVNECHRSEKAYAKLLDESDDPSISIRLQNGGFVACSGATAEHITATGWWGEDPQVDAITADTDLVTITIGGNNAYFKEFIEACLKPFTGGCADDTDVYAAAMAKINEEVPGKLATAYGGLKTRLDNVDSDATVLVVGYPFIIREQVLGGTCAAEMSQEEEQAAEAVALALNQKVIAAVQQLNDSRFEFVDAQGTWSPFEGHDLCGGSSYFHNWVPTNYEYSAHPNQDGQAAYAELIRSALQ